MTSRGELASTISPSRMGWARLIALSVALAAAAAAGALAALYVSRRQRALPQPPSASAKGWHCRAARAADVTGAPVAPGLVTAGTDSRFLAEVAQDTYRFQPITLSMSETTMIHGVDERMTLENLDRMVRFYARLMATAAR